MCICVNDVEKIRFSLRSSSAQVTANACQTTEPFNSDKWEWNSINSYTYTHTRPALATHDKNHVYGVSVRLVCHIYERLCACVVETFESSKQYPFRIDGQSFSSRRQTNTPRISFEISPIRQLGDKQKPENTKPNQRIERAAWQAIIISFGIFVFFILISIWLALERCWVRLQPLQNHINKPRP